MTGNDFEAAGGTAPGLAAEFVGFLRHNRKWWLGPLVLLLVAFGALLAFSGGAAAPFLYTLF